MCASEIPVQPSVGFKAALLVALRTISATCNISINLINANVMSQIRSAMYWGEEQKETTDKDIKLFQYLSYSSPPSFIPARTH